VNSSAGNILSEGASELGIALDEGRLAQFDTFTSLLLEWNGRFNLTRITEPAEIAVKHYLDSLSLLAVVEIPSGASVIDIGTGAGFPGIPLKIARPDLKITMLDSVKKKLAFLEAAVAGLGLRDVALIHGRAEDVGKDKTYRERHDLVVSRAVSRLSVLSELCIPFCRIGGRFAAYKGVDVDDELRESAEAIRILGGELEAAHKFTLPQSDLKRTLVVVRKVRSTPGGYPRKAGVPERNPL
jgi:16S rRNA (guanine527-N7)-methyltransferase